MKVPHPHKLVKISSNYLCKCFENLLTLFIVEISGHFLCVPDNIERFIKVEKDPKFSYMCVCVLMRL